MNISLPEYENTNVFKDLDSITKAQFQQRYYTLVPKPMFTQAGDINQDNEISEDEFKVNSSFTTGIDEITCIANDSEILNSIRLNSNKINETEDEIDINELIIKKVITNNDIAIKISKVKKEFESFFTHDNLDTWFIKIFNSVSNFLHPNRSNN